MLRSTFALMADASLAIGNLVTPRGAIRHREVRRIAPASRAADVPAHDVDVIQARPTPTSITLSVMATRDIDATLSYEAGLPPRPLTLRALVPLDVEITGLRPDQFYRYTISAGAPLATGSFRTARVANEPFAFAVRADAGPLTDDPRAYTNTLTNILADRPDFLVDLSDATAAATSRTSGDRIRTHLARRYYLGLVSQHMPVYLAPHGETREARWPRLVGADADADDAAARERYFPPVQAGAFYSVAPAGSGGYAWTWGDALFVVLEPRVTTGQASSADADGWAWTLGGAQYDWLRATLTASRAPYTFVFVPRLPGSTDARIAGFEWDGTNADRTAGFAAHRPDWPMPVHNLLAAHGVSAVFHGQAPALARQERDGILYQAVPRPDDTVVPHVGAAAGSHGGASPRPVGAGHLRVLVSGAGAIIESVTSRLVGHNPDVADRATIAPRA